MNATQTPSTVATASQRWSSLKTIAPTLPTEDHAEFFATAPTGTVVQVWDDLFSRVPDGDWINLNEIVQGDGEYTSSTNESYAPGELVSWAARSGQAVAVLRLR